MELTQLKTWSDLLEFGKTLTPEQLNQPVKMWGDQYASDLHSVEVLDEDYINPSGDGCEPLSAYANEEDDYSDEPVCYPAGTIMFNGFEDDKSMRIHKKINEAAFNTSLKQLGDLYEEGKSHLHGLSILEEENGSYWPLFDILKDMRDIAAVALQKLYIKEVN